VFQPVLFVYEKYVIFTETEKTVLFFAVCLQSKVADAIMRLKQKGA